MASSSGIAFGEGGSERRSGTCSWLELGGGKSLLILGSHGWE